MKKQLNDLKAEKTVLGSVLVDKDQYIVVRDILTKESFYDIRNSHIFDALSNIYSRGENVDIITVNNELQKAGITDLFDYLVDIQSSASYFNVYEHAAIIHDKAIRRKFYVIAKELEEHAFSEIVDIVDVVSKTKAEIDNLFVDKTDSVIPIKEAVDDLIDNINRNSTCKHELTGMPSLYIDFDKKSGGFQGGDLVIIAGETSQGKTSLALNICSNVADSGYPCAIYSMEMSSKQITAKLAAKETGIPTNSLLFFQMRDYEFKQFDDNIGKLCDKEIYIDQRSTANIERIVSSIRSMNAKLGIKFVVVDYLQLISTNDRRKQREEMTADAARLLKNIAKELDICIVALSQLSRDRDNPRPTISRLRNSGQIEEAADTVMLLYRPEIYGRKFPEPFDNIDPFGTAMIDVAKGRNIGIFKFLLMFNPETQVFSQMSEYQEFAETKKIESSF